MGKVNTCFDAVLERLLAVTQHLLQRLRFIGQVETVAHHVAQGLGVMEVQHLKYRKTRIN